MKARIPKHREFIITFPEGTDEARNQQAWDKLNELLEAYKKAHNGNCVFEPTFIEDVEPQVKALQAEYGFNYTIEER